MTFLSIWCLLRNAWIFFFFFFLHFYYSLGPLDIRFFYYCGLWVPLPTATCRGLFQTTMICIPPLPNLYIEILSPKDNGISRWVFGRNLKVVKVEPSWLRSVLHKRDFRDIPTCFCHVKMQWEVWHPERDPHPITLAPWSWTLSLQHCEINFFGL